MAAGQHTGQQKPGSKANDKSKEYYFTASSVEAVVSVVALDMNLGQVSFPDISFQNFAPESILRPVLAIARPVYLEILFEHLIAPNAP